MREMQQWRKLEGGRDSMWRKWMEADEKMNSDKRKSVQKHSKQKNELDAAERRIRCHNYCCKLPASVSEADAA